MACELRETIDTARDSEIPRVIPNIIPVLIEVLRSGEPSFKRDTTEFKFRSVLVDILHRIPSGDAIRPQALPLFQGMLYLLRHDNEENGVTCCKTIIDIVRGFKALSEEIVAEFFSTLLEMFRNMKSLVQETLSEDSSKLDPDTVFTSVRSFKVLAEMGMVVMTFMQSHRAMVTSAMQPTIPLTLEVLALESPAQKKAREDCEAMGSIWAGVAPTIKNNQAYSDFINAQIKVKLYRKVASEYSQIRQLVSYLTFTLRGMGEQFETFGEALVLTSLRLCQDCPPNAIISRRVSFKGIYFHQS